MVETILRIQSVKANTGHSRSSLYSHMAQGLFPRQIRLSVRSVGWPGSEVAAMVAARIAGKSDDEIRALVEKLESTRKRAA